MRTLLVGMLVLAGCSMEAAGLETADPTGGAGSGFGATTGGVKDLTLARELIANGVIPPSDALLVEAMFAEHDLPLSGGTCQRVLCLRAAAGFAPEVDGTPRGWAQVGLSSTVDPATWQRPATTFVFTVDISGSMQWDTVDPEYPSAGELARATLHALTDQLRADDRVAIVTYGSTVATALDVVPGNNRAAIHAAIDALSEGGSTNMEAGMQRAYQVGAATRAQTRQTRVIVFADTQPNVGATTGSEFATMVDDAQELGVHTTVLAFGLGIGPEVMRGMASLRGANAYSMSRHSEVASFIADDYPWFTTPIAYDLRVAPTLAGGWSIDRGLGFPAVDDASQIGLEASTVFLSKGRGALLAALRPGAQATPASLAGRFSLTYREAPDGLAIVEDAPFAYDGAPLDTRGQWFAQHGVARTTALALLTEGMHAAAVVYATDPVTAESIMAAAHERFASDAATLADDDLPVEVELGAALLQLIHDRATQGTLYGEH